ncbi:DUF7715 family protein [Actinomycetospora sp. C-140]
MLRRVDDIAPEEHLERSSPVRSSLQAQGWDACACCSTDEADDLAEYVAGWPVGTIVERRLDLLHVRALPNELAA